MYICLCRGVTQKQIRREVLAGAVSYDEVQERLEVGLCCGTCSDSAREVIAETLSMGLGEESNVVSIERNVIQMWSPVRKTG